MPYLNEAGLAYYDPKLKEWIASQPVKTLPSTLYPWTLTDKAGAVTCWPVGGTQLLPTVDFLFSETGPASGDKGPENPSTISGVSSVNVGRIGKNLLLQKTGSSGSYTISRNNDGSLSISGSGAALFAVTDSGGATSGPFSSVVLDINKSYTLSVEVVSGSINNTAVNIAQSAATQRSVSIPASGKASTTFTPSSVGYVDGRFVCRMLFNSNTVATNAVLKIQLEEGDTVTDFEAPMLPADANHDLPLGNTYYGGTLDVASGVMTVTWYGYAFDGTENWAFNATTPYSNFVLITDYPAPSGSALAPVYPQEKCSHFNVNNSVNPQIEHFIVYGNRVEFYATQASLADWKAWLASEKTAGHPIAVAYPLATPYTVQFSPTSISALAQTDKYTPRLNTIYTDASAVQVGYVKSPIREEYELTQAIVGQGGNI